jgi:hypothetical protein
LISKKDWDKIDVALYLMTKSANMINYVSDKTNKEEEYAGIKEH